MEDRKILELLWQRAENAIEVLQKAYGKLLHRIAHNILRDTRDVQECVNDTYLAIWNAIPPERPEPLSPYVCKTGRNIALNRLRRDNAQRRCSNYAISLDELSEILPCPDDALSARALGRAIDAFLATQTYDSRRLFLRRYWFGDSVQDAANFVGITPNAASVRLKRLRQALKEYLMEEELYYE